MTRMAIALPGERRLYIVAGTAAFAAMLANLVDVAMGFGGEMVTPGARPAADWFLVFARSPFDGLYALGLFNVFYMLLMLPVYAGLLAAHRHTHPVPAGFALLLSWASRASRCSRASLRSFRRGTGLRSTCLPAQAACSRSPGSP